MKIYKNNKREVSVYKLKPCIRNQKYQMDRNYDRSMTFAEVFETKDYFVGINYNNEFKKAALFTLNKNTFEEKSFSLLNMYSSIDEVLDGIKDLKKARNFFEFWEAVIKNNPKQFEFLPTSIFDKNNENSKYLQKFIEVARTVVKQNASNPPKEADFALGKQVLAIIKKTIENNQEIISKENAEREAQQKKSNEQQKQFDQLLQQFSNVDEDVENN